ncbi:MAG: glycine cleavage system aminomethyltransferase GcvT [Candidatus Omnitrophica bacterium]|nr:glycine cleavage system aminomethyltransferase GcvT [Candidatus Omnitrophota bacterium]
MSTEVVLHNTPLLEEHIALGAKMVGFGGWNMPLQYEGILTEWDYNRRTCSLFDCSHMGEFIIKGDAVESGLDGIVTQRLTDIPPKTCRYGAMLNAQGGVIDDLIVYRKAPQEWMIVVNAANSEKNAKHFKDHLTSKAVFQDISFETAKLDLQGPLSRDILKTLVPGIAKLEYYTFDEFTLLKEKCLISRTGYTGELGYEIYYPWEKSKELWQAILKNDKVKPTGLGVRDVLRIEMCYSLYGHELDETISPLEVGLDKFIDFDKDFIGKEVLLKQKAQGSRRAIGCFTSESRRSPRAGHKIFNEAGRIVGEVTSGTFSPALQSGIGLGFVEKPTNTIGQKLFFGDEKTKAAAAVVKRPFYKSGSLKH